MVSVSSTPEIAAVGAQIATTARIAKIVERIGKITSERSLFNTPQLCLVTVQPHEIRPIVALPSWVAAENRVQRTAAGKRNETPPGQETRVFRVLHLVGVAVVMTGAGVLL